MSNLTDFMFPKATEQQAKDGVSNSVLMTPLTVDQYVDDRKGKGNGLAALDENGRVVASQATGLGYSQVWQEVSRETGVSYFNSTSRPIILAVAARGSNSNSIVTTTIEVSADNINWTLISQNRNVAGNNIETFQVVIPPDHYYRYSTINHTESRILELR